MKYAGNLHPITSKNLTRIFMAKETRRVMYKETQNLSVFA